MEARVRKQCANSQGQARSPCRATSMRMLGPETAFERCCCCADLRGPLSRCADLRGPPSGCADLRGPPSGCADLRGPLSSSGDCDGRAFTRVFLAVGPAFLFVL